MAKRFSKGATSELEASIVSAHSDIHAPPRLHYVLKTAAHRYLVYSVLFLHIVAASNSEIARPDLYTSLRRGDRSQLQVPN